MMEYNSKIIIGSAQFGLLYGINNQSGAKVPYDEVYKILHYAYDKGINMIDTSYAYGDSELVLGNVMDNSLSDINIISKYSKSRMSVNDTFNDTLKRLKRQNLYGYLVHHFDYYIQNSSIFDDIKCLKEEGKVQKIGFSLYKVEELYYLLDRNIDFDIVQFPYNIFDRSFELLLDEIKKHHIEIHVRSVFLQGLFFKDLTSLPEKLKSLKPQLEMLHSYCNQKEISVEELALNYIIQNKNVDYVLVGLDTQKQLEHNISILNKEISQQDIDFIQSLVFPNQEFLNPVNWN